jgi:PHD/YefM family antitoxin component YafN of YafNO toxin-antitoxin module
MLEDNATVIITNRGRGESVLIPIEDYQDYEEYLHYRYVRESLVQAEAYAADPTARWYSDDEFWDAVEAS